MSKVNEADNNIEDFEESCKHVKLETSFFVSQRKPTKLFENLKGIKRNNSEWVAFLFWSWNVFLEQREAVSERRLSCQAAEWLTSWEFPRLGARTLCIAPVVPSVGSLQTPSPGSAAIFYLSPPSYDSRPRRRTGLVSLLRMVCGCRPYQVAGLRRCLCAGIYSAPHGVRDAAVKCQITIDRLRSRGCFYN